jgi:hypothetical protein
MLHLAWPAAKLAVLLHSFSYRCLLAVCVPCKPKVAAPVHFVIPSSLYARLASPIVAAWVHCFPGGLCDLPAKGGSTGTLRAP